MPIKKISICIFFALLNLSISQIAFAAEDSNSEAKKNGHRPFSLGIIPLLDEYNKQLKLGVAVEFEIKNEPHLPIFFRFGWSSIDVDDSNRYNSYLKSRNWSNVSYGTRYHLTPGPDRWVLSLAGNHHIITYRYDPPNYGEFSRNETEFGLHLAVSYRWVWESGAYIMLGTGPRVPVYTNYETPIEGKQVEKWFYGKWYIFGMSSIGFEF